MGAVNEVTAVMLLEVVLPVTLSVLVTLLVNEKLLADKLPVAVKLPVTLAPAVLNTVTLLVPPTPTVTLPPELTTVTLDVPRLILATLVITPDKNAPLPRIKLPLILPVEVILPVVATALVDLLNVNPAVELANPASLNTTAVLGPDTVRGPVILPITLPKKYGADTLAVVVNPVACTLPKIKLLVTELALIVVLPM